MSNRREATKDDIGDKAWFSNNLDDWTDSERYILKIVDSLYYDNYENAWKHCEVEQELITLTLSEHSKLLEENAKLKAELAELKKGDVETECWYLVEDKDRDERVMFLTKTKLWSIYSDGSVCGADEFSYYTIKERLYKASEVEG